MEFNELYKLAFNVSNESIQTKTLEVGSVGCAILTETNNVYLGKNLDMCCSVGMCAERNAISSMLTYESSKIIKLVCVHKSGKIIMPCGVCREFMKQLGDISKETEILVSLNPLKSIKLDELINHWWKEEI